MGAQGYSSCSDMNYSQEAYSKLTGMDTYLAHLNNSPKRYDAQSIAHSNLQSMKSIKSKAYGMESGNWIGMDASIQNSILQDTFINKNKEDFKQKQNEQLEFQNFGLQGKGNIKVYEKQQINNMNQGGEQTKFSSNRQTIQQRQPSNAYNNQNNILNQISLDETMLLMNQSQNNTIYQITEAITSKQATQGLYQTDQYFRKVDSPRRMQSPTNIKSDNYSINKKYFVTFKIFYQTEYGESLQVVGNIKELGSWKAYNCPLKWSEGHVWISEQIQITSCSYFLYKYVVMHQDKALKWEQGPKRIADLEILPDRNRIGHNNSSMQNSFSNNAESRSGVKSQSSSKQYSVFTGQFGQQSSQSIQDKEIQLQTSTQKTVELKDEWETFSIRFSISSPCLNEQDGESLRIIGSVPELTKQGSLVSGPKKMKRCSNQFRWLFDKYGQEMRPWECQIKLKSDQIQQMQEIIYSYSKSSQNKKDIIYEREPSRIIQIQDPENYKGELGAQKSSQWRNWDKIWIVNGHVEKADGNFLGELFFEKIGDTGISLGTYPNEEQDIQRLLQAGITGVLSLMNMSDYRQRGVKQSKVMQWYHKRNIKIINFPVSDMREQDLESNLFIAAQHLNNMVNSLKLNVYIHCNSGLSRSPAVLITYMCLFKKIKCWERAEDVLKFVKTMNSKLCPNMRVVKKCLATNKQFQMNQLEGSHTQLKGNNQIEESFYFPNMVIEESKLQLVNPIQNIRNDIQNQVIEEEEFDFASEKQSTVKDQNKNAQSSRQSQKTGELSPITNIQQLDQFYLLGNENRVSVISNDFQDLKQNQFDQQFKRQESQKVLNKYNNIKLDDKIIKKENTASYIPQSHENEDQNLKLKIQKIPVIDDKKEQLEQFIKRRKDLEQEIEDERQKLLKIQEKQELKKQIQKNESSEIKIDEVKIKEDIQHQQKVNIERIKEEIELKLRNEMELLMKQQLNQNFQEQIQNQQNLFNDEKQKSLQDLTLKLNQEFNSQIYQIEKENEKFVNSLKFQHECEIKKYQEQNLNNIKEIEQLTSTLQSEKMQNQQNILGQQEKFSQELKILREEEQSFKQSQDQQIQQLKDQILENELQLKKLEMVKLREIAEKDQEIISIQENSKSQNQVINSLKAEKRIFEENFQNIFFQKQQDYEKLKILDQSNVDEIQNLKKQIIEIQMVKDNEIQRLTKIIQEKDLKEKGKMELEKIKEQERLQQEKVKEKQKKEFDEIKEQERIQSEKIKEQERIEREKIQEKEIENIKKELQEALEKLKQKMQFDKEIQTEDSQKKQKSECLTERKHIQVFLKKNKQEERFLSPVLISSRRLDSKINCDVKREFQISSNENKTQAEQNIVFNIEKNLNESDYADNFLELEKKADKNFSQSKVNQIIEDALNRNIAEKQIEDLKNIQKKQIEEEYLNNLRKNLQIEFCNILNQINEEYLENTLKKNISQIIKECEIEQSQEQKKEQEDLYYNLNDQYPSLISSIQTSSINDKNNQIYTAENQTTESSFKNKTIDIFNARKLRLQQKKEEQRSRKNSSQSSKNSNVSQTKSILQIQKEPSINLINQSNLSQMTSTLINPIPLKHEEERKKIFADTDAEIEHIRHLRLLEEEKLKLLKLAQKVEEHRTQLKQQQDSNMVFTDYQLSSNKPKNPQRYKSPASPFEIMSIPHEISDIEISKIKKQGLEAQNRTKEEESIFLDYQNERQEISNDIGKWSNKNGVKKIQQSLLAKKRDESTIEANEQEIDGGSIRKQGQKSKLSYFDSTQNTIKEAIDNDIFEKQKYATQNLKNEKPFNQTHNNDSNFLQKINEKIDFESLQFEQMVEDFFQVCPLKFRARRGVKLEEAMQLQIKKTKSCLPVIYIRGSLYLIGAYKCICDLKNEQVLVKVQANFSGSSNNLQQSFQMQNLKGSIKMDKFLQDNEKDQQRVLCKLMLENKMSLESVCQIIIKAQKPTDLEQKTSIVGQFFKNQLMNQSKANLL